MFLGGFMDYSKYQPLFELIERELRTRKRTVLAIDGAAASGKTTLAKLLEERYGAAVVHMDDFFLPAKRKTEDRLSQFDGNIDRERFAAEVLPHIGRAEPFSYGRYDCSAGCVTSQVNVAPSNLAVVEGVYSLSPYFEGAYHLKLMLTIDSQTQIERLRIRCTPEIFENFKKIWLPLEERYFSMGKIKDKCDMVL
jgi:uridine kinase